jgi:putative flippase GtrA
MQQHARALKFVVVGTVGTVAAAFLVISMFQFVAPKAEATPAIGQGKPCGACHTSASPSKGDVKK